MSNWRDLKKSVTVRARTMKYVEMGSGDPVVFQHGNPMSSYLWRNIMPHLSEHGRCIAIDLIGMGDSDKLPDSGPESYSFMEHRSYLEGALRELGVEKNVTLVIHDWGSALGFDWANRHRHAVKRICYMEAFVRPFEHIDNWGEAKAMFDGMRSQHGEQMVLEENFWIEQLLPMDIIRDLEPDEFDEYRRPFLSAGEDRRPTLTFPREIPIGGSPTDVHEAMSSYSEWMATNDLPKLFINAEPGALLVGEEREFCRTWKNQNETTVKGIHFIQEDSPDEITKALDQWLTATA